MSPRLTFLLCIFLPVTAFSQTPRQKISLDSSNLVNSSFINMTDTLQYATFCFYRSYIPKMNAPIKVIPIYINDSLVAQLKANTAVMYRIVKEGRVKIAIDKKGESQFLAKVKLGKVYYFKCEVVKGLWFGKPTIEAVPEKIGRDESGFIEKD